MSELLELDEILRRVIAARVSDRHVVEDLVQEALVRVAAHQGRLDSDELQAYAITTARHLVISNARRQSVHHRLAHRLVDYTTIDGPEQLALDADETRALAVALQGLDPPERDLLLRHEVDDVTTQQLGDELGVSAGGVAMRLARARARLRVDFVLAYRHVTLPTAHCRSVLLALSAGDHRRQHALHATEHLTQCETCAQLAAPVSERRRGIAVWLFAPAAALLRRAWSTIRTNPAAQVALVATTTIAIGAGVIAVRPSADSGADTVQAARAAPTDIAATTTLNTAPVNPPPATTASPTTTASPATSATMAAPTTPTTASTATPADVATPVTSCPPDPLAQADSPPTTGCPVPAVVITATDVATDEGFLATIGDDGRQIWVQLVGSGESTIDIDTGTTATITGIITATVPAEPPIDVRVQDMGWYITVDYDDIVAN